VVKKAPAGAVPVFPAGAGSLDCHPGSLGSSKAGLRAPSMAML
jgi:hypothetical protein